MIGESWLLSAMLALIGLQVLTLAIAYWRGEGPFATADRDQEAMTSSGAVQCPDCGAENGPEFRYCRRCVTDLPGAISNGSTPMATLGRESR